MKRLCILIFLFLSGCGVNEISETENSDITVDTSENTEIEVDEVFENAVSENDNINQFQTGSFNLPVFNGECIYSEAEALQELQTLREVNNLDFDINIIYQTGPVKCVGKVWGANLAQGALIDESISYIDLIVGKDDLNNQSRAKVPSEYSRTSDLGSIQANLLFDFSTFGDYITDIDYFDNLETYFFVGHQKSMIYSFDKESSEIKPLVDLSSFVGTTENWETGLLSMNPIKFEDNKLYFLAGYTDKEIRVSISIFSYDYGIDTIKKEKELFLSPQNSNLDWLNCGNIERVNQNTWVFCVGDQDSLYALNETSLRTDLYSGKLIMFSMNESFEVYPASTPSYDPEIFSPVGGDVRPESVLSTPGIKSKFEIEYILALGFRNPWGFAVGDGYIFAPDVGLNKVEEINFVDLNSLDPKFFGWPHKEGEFYYAKDEIGKFWDYEVKPIYSHASVDERCANIGGAIHKSESLPGWNEYFFFLDQCTFEIFIINKSGDNVFRTRSESIKVAPVVVKNDKDGNIIISTYTGQIFWLDLSSLNLSG